MIAAPLRHCTLTALLLLATASVAAATTIAGSGNLRTETRAVTGFTGIALAVPGRLTLGDAIVWARDELNVTVAGSGNVRYYGDPAVKHTVVGSGSVKRPGAMPA